MSRSNGSWLYFLSNCSGDSQRMIGERYFSPLNLAKQEMCRDRHAKTDWDRPFFESVYEVTFLRRLPKYMVSYSSCIPLILKRERR
jgi:hypothetical protein